MTDKNSDTTFLFDTNFFIRLKEHREPKNLSRTLDEYSDFFDDLRSLGTTFSITDSVLEELVERQIKAWIKKTKFKIEKSDEIPDEIKEGMVFALETYCPAKDGFSAARIEEELIVTDKGCQVISLFPAEDLPIANKY